MVSSSSTVQFSVWSVSWNDAQITLLWTTPKIEDTGGTYFIFMVVRLNVLYYSDYGTVTYIVVVPEFALFAIL